MNRSKLEQHRFDDPATEYGACTARSHESEPPTEYGAWQLRNGHAVVDESPWNRGVDLAAVAPNQLIAVAWVTHKYVYDELLYLSDCERLQHPVFQRLHGGSLVGKLHYFAVKHVATLPSLSQVDFTGFKK